LPKPTAPVGTPIADGLSPWIAIGKIERPDLRYTPEVAEATAPIYEKVKHIIPAIEWPALAPDNPRHQQAEERAQRGYPGAQLHDAGHLSRRCGYRRRQLAACHRGDPHRRGGHRPVRRALHGGNLQDPEPGKDRADPGHARRLFAGRIDHRRGCARPCASATRASRSSPM
jgi:hypothetical protein